MESSKDAIKARRDKDLDEAMKAWKDYYENELKAIDAEKQLLESVLKARGGANALAKANVARSKILVIDDINSLLTG